MPVKFSRLVSVLFLLSGCTTVQIGTDKKSEEYDYNMAIADAAVIEASEIKILPVISGNRVKVVTWTPYPNSYIKGQQLVLNWGDVWVTLEGEVQSRCRHFQAAQLVSDIKKLLGLPLANTQEKRSFVTLEVTPDALFRPCANPDIRADRCGTDFPDDINSAHTAWFARQTATAYQTDKGYPWTRLGYTYNWKSGEDEVGPAEFVVKKGSKALTIAISDTTAYCRK